MQKTSTDYSNTIIYKITCRDKSISDVYVGHTTNFVQRKKSHEQCCININLPNSHCKLYEVIRKNGGWINWKMEIIYFFECHNLYEAKKKEQEYFIALNATLNTIEPLPKQKEFKKDETDNKIIKPKKSVIDQIANMKSKKTTYECTPCKFSCNKSSELQRHIATSKHIRLSIATADESVLKTFICEECEKQYKSKQGLDYHNIKCRKNEEDLPKTTHVEDVHLKILIGDIVKSNAALQLQNQELQKNVLQVLEKMQMVITAETTK